MDKPRLSLVPVDERPDGTMAGIHVWFEVPLKGGWRAAYRLFPRDGQVIVAELRIFPDTGSPGYEPAEWSVEDRGFNAPCPDNGVTARLVRDEVVLGKHIYTMLPALLQKAAGRELTRMGKRKDARLAHKMFDEWIGSLGFGADTKPHVARRGPKGWPDQDYATLAADYLDRCNAGSRSPVADVAGAYGMSVSAMRGALHRARNRGLLTRQKQGRAGGVLTPKAKAVLRQTADKTKAKKKQARRER